MAVVRITWGKVRPGSWDEFEADVKKVIEEVGPAPGLLGRSMARDLHNRDAGYSMSMWETAEYLERYENTDLYKRITPRLQSFFTGEYRTDRCELHHWNLAKAPERLIEG